MLLTVALAALLQTACVLGQGEHRLNSSLHSPALSRDCLGVWQPALPCLQAFHLASCAPS